MDSTKLKNRMNTKMAELETPAPLPFEMGLAPVNADFAALSNNALSVIRENLKNQPLSLDFFDVVKSPSGGSTVFSVPGLNGDEAETELTGIILDYTTPSFVPAACSLGQKQKCAAFFSVMIGRISLSSVSAARFGASAEGSGTFTSSDASASGSSALIHSKRSPVYSAGRRCSPSSKRPHPDPYSIRSGQFRTRILSAAYPSRQRAARSPRGSGGSSSSPVGIVSFFSPVSSNLKSEQ